MPQTIHPKVSIFACIGAIFLIVGTTIGGGMLALPVVTSTTGFTDSSLALIVIWFLMTMGAWLILEANIKYPVGTHLITTAKNTLGKFGMWISLFLYILLMYSLLSAYFSAGLDLVQALASFDHILISHALALLIFAVIFCSIVVFGIKSVDMVNRCIMSLKIIAFIALVLIAGRYIQVGRLFDTGTMPGVKVTMAMVTAFGYSPLIPSIRRLIPNTQQLRRVVLIGGFAPLVCYIIWEMVIFGVIPVAGKLGLAHLAVLPNPIQHLMMAISQLTHDEAAKISARVFTSICVMTAFLGVSISLSDCLRDTLAHMKSDKFGRKTANLLTFAPPLIIVLFFPAIFVFCIGFAGIVCVLLLMMIPAAMGLKIYKSPKVRFWIWVYLLVTIVLLVVAFLAY